VRSASSVPVTHTVCVCDSVLSATVGRALRASGGQGISQRSSARVLRMQLLHKTEALR
jgi:hypothetical protein